MKSPENPSSEETRVLRELAREVAAAAASETNRERIRLWKKHNALQPERPMILLFPEGGWTDIEAEHPETRTVCRDPFWRPIETRLRRELHAFRHFDSDNVVTPEITVPKAIESSGWGVEPRWTYAEFQRGARRFDPVFHERRDLDRMRHPVPTHHEDISQQRLTRARELFDDLLPVRLVGVKVIQMSLMAQWTSLRGLEETMMDMVCDPEFLHAAMQFLLKGHIGWVEALERDGLLDLNHDNSYHSSGGNGWLEEPPGGAVSADRPITRGDLWGSAQTQELTLVSPEMHDEFSMAYEREFLEPFALSGYACCDDLTPKLDRVLTIPHIRRVSVSPFADVDRCAEELGNRVVYSWKPRPTDLVGQFQPERIRSYLRHTLEVCRAHGCVLEMILKDTHTADGHPERFDRWSDIAREEVERIVG